HASLHNAIECIFGVMKCWWQVLQFPPEFGMNIQVLLLMALCTLHNFIRWHDPDGFQQDFGDDRLEIQADDDVNGGFQGDDICGELADGPATAAERRGADEWRDRIADAMWEDYVQEQARRGLAIPAQV
ncbi:hypothetical protein BDR05DRAFT_886489, partial [Suillus weaverae]